MACHPEAKPRVLRCQLRHPEAKPRDLLFDRQLWNLYLAAAAQARRRQSRRAALRNDDR